MKIAFVIPWFHEKIGGGAEAQCRDAALLLSRSGCDVTILTTCIRDHMSDWNANFFPPGETTELGLRILRFPADRTDRGRFDHINARYMAMGGGEKHPLSEEEEETFFRSMAPSSALLEYVEKNRKAYDFFIFIPYLFHSSVYGPALAGSRSLLIPCLHDEGYAYSRPVARSFAAAGGIIFNTRSEQSLASAIVPVAGKRQAVVGDCVDMGSSAGDGDLFRRHRGLEDPFILCLGRRDSTKRTDVLIRYFLAYKKLRRSSLRLVLAGPGEVDTFGSPEILDVGFLDKAEKYGALAACAFLCNPSLNESFSIVLLEAWANRRPALVASGCPPTTELCRRSGGGLWFDSFASFAAAADYLVSREESARAMGESGYRFTEENYSAGVVAKKYLLLLKAWQSGGEPDFAAGAEKGFRKGMDSEAIMEELLSGLEPLPEPAPPPRPLHLALRGAATEALKKLRRAGRKP
jgi:glycosyltransferase involved in cell wall biosynthesis